MSDPSDRAGLPTPRHDKFIALIPPLTQPERPTPAEIAEAMDACLGDADMGWRAIVVNPRLRWVRDAMRRGCIIVDPADVPSKEVGHVGGQVRAARYSGWNDCRAAVFGVSGE